jgi:GntR family transcriptional regulator / MocR family aminotransferase
MPSPVLPLLVTDLTRAGRGTKRGARPLHHQLYTSLREAILTGRLAPGSRLPATRTLAADLGLGRNTVLSAYDQLHAEGYLDGRVGSGSFVTAELPVPRPTRRTGPRPSTAAPASRPPATPRTGPRLGPRARRFVNMPVTLARGGPPRAFRAGVPALDLFPVDAWARLVARAWKDVARTHLGYADALGYPPLREAIAAHVRASRAVRCDASQVIITNGAQQAMHLIAHALLEPGDVVWFEDPGYRGARVALQAAGMDLAPIPIDAEGLRVDEGVRRAPQARAAYVTPSHQYPLGVTMSLARRLELLAWARQQQAWIVEDDYDSEFRYTGRPLASLQGLDTADRVIYVGTFSKVLCPALRVGYLVAPAPLVETLAIARGVADRHGATLDQAALARFMDDGGLVRHVRQMRTRYAERQEVLVSAAARELCGLLDVTPQPAGLHLVGWLPEGADDRAAAERAWAHGIETSPLSTYSASGRSPRPGLMLGYAGVSAAAIRTGVRTLATALGEEESIRRRATRPGRSPRPR